MVSTASQDGGVMKSGRRRRLSCHVKGKPLSAAVSMGPQLVHLPLDYLEALFGPPMPCSFRRTAASAVSRRTFSACLGFSSISSLPPWLAHTQVVYVRRPIS